MTIEMEDQSDLRLGFLAAAGQGSVIEPGFSVQRDRRHHEAVTMSWSGES